MKIKTSLSLVATILGLCAQAQAAPTHIKQIKSNFVLSSYAKTKHPTIFVHGMLGFNRIGTDAFGLDYFYQILPDLARNGANVWAARVSPFNSSEIRGEQLLQQVDEVLALTGQQKVNLFGHSHGGHSIRYLAGVAPHKVVSMSSIGAPHKGSPTADLIMRVESTPLEQPVAGVINFISMIIVAAQGVSSDSFPHDSLATGKSLSVAGSADFTSRFPLGIPTTSCGDGPAQANGIHIYSFAGRAALTNLLDPDSVLLVTSKLMNNGGDNDGLVPRCSTKFGKTIRDDFKWNHLDEVNQILGLKSIFAPEPASVYRQHLNRLKLQGL